jgi:hypothetical protein
MNQGRQIQILYGTLTLWLPVLVASWAAADEPKWRFVAAGQEYTFDTGLLHGTLRGGGRSMGLSAVAEPASTTNLTHSLGLFSHYRLLDAGARYGHAGWDWPSTARLLPDGSVEVSWQADAEHPFAMQALYRWKAANVLDLRTTVTARKELRRFEAFLASYFKGFPSSRVYANRGNSAEFVAAERSAGDWQAFPRDDEAVKIIGDGRWRRPPNPVDWKIRPTLAAPLGLRRDEKSGLTALIMARRQDCFAVLTPFGGDGHGSLYLSLFGRDLAAGQTVSAETRLVIGRGISDQQAVSMYEEFAKISPK